jgi:hypothetical protein
MALLYYKDMNSTSAQGGLNLGKEKKKEKKKKHIPL